MEVKILSPQGLGKKKEIRREAPKKILAPSFSQWLDEIELSLKTAGKILSRGLKPW